MKKLYSTVSIFLLAMTAGTWAQCNFTDPINAIDTIFIDNPSGSENNVGLVYNPDFDVYYNFRLGSTSYLMTTIDASTGTILDQQAVGYDFRGADWNPNTNRIDFNTYNGSGYFSMPVDASGIPDNGATVTLQAGNTQPDPQSSATFDYTDNLIWYYDGTSFISYDQTTFTLQNTLTVTGTPAGATLSSDRDVAYVGCPGRELAMYDIANHEVLLYDKSTGVFDTSIALPGTAVTTGSWNMGYSNNRFWLRNQNTDEWYGYYFIDGFTGIEEPARVEASLYPNPTSDMLSINLADNTKTRYSIISISGQEVQNGTITSGSTSVDVQDLANGVYMLQLSTATSVTTYRFVKK